MHILQVASEIAPIAKIGGLADVMMGLSRELVKMGHTVDICVPRYDCLDASQLRFLPNEKIFKSYYDGRWYDNSVVRADYNGDFHLSLMSSSHPDRFFQRGEIYGAADDVDRFLYFSRAVLDWLKASHMVPDVIHVHDWETAPIACLIHEEEFREYFKHTRVVLTIHNLEYQGWCSAENLAKVRLSSQVCQLNNGYNLLKGGIVSAHHVTTVSPNYAKEVLTSQGGRGLEDILKRCKNKFSGILNGIDEKFWDPATDMHVLFPFSIQNFPEKHKNKRALLKMLHMSADDTRPLVVSVARLVPQKGIELIKYAMSAAKERYQFILLGTSHDKAVQSEFESLRDKYSQENNVRIVLKTEEGMAHKIYAAADMVFVPSLFEPCGLVQLIALRYGAIPIVRSTGGLLDTICDGENGFSFDYPDVGGVEWALGRALELWKNKKSEWDALAVHCMQCNFNWAQSGLEYVQVYGGNCKTPFGAKSALFSSDSDFS